MELLSSILAIALRAGTSLVWATLGEIFAERSGVLNLGLEGIMLTGAVSSFAVAYHTGSIPLAIATALCVGVAMAAIHAFLSITMRANQVVSGLSLTLFGTGLASFLGQRIGPASNNLRLVGLQGPRIVPFEIPWLSDLPVVGAFFRQDPLTWAMYLAIPLCWFWLWRTKKGLWLRAVGEDPRAADAMGIDVIRTRWAYTLLGGALVALGGAHLSLSYTPGWSENITGGRGWIVIALVIFSGWNPSRAILGALLFGGINAIQFRLQASGADVPAAFLNMLPYLATIVVLAAMTAGGTLSRRFGAPAALSTPYVREDK
jgi:simple sugar transport system permease protein